MHKAIHLLHQAKQNEIEIFLKEEQLKFKVPKNRSISDSLLKEIHDNKQLLIDFLSKHKKANTTYTRISKIDNSLVTRIPLSFSQERLFFIDRLEGSVQYHIPAVLRLRGKLNRQAI